jgi:hypothetical protein
MAVTAPGVAGENTWLVSQWVQGVMVRHQNLGTDSGLTPDHGSGQALCGVLALKL